MEASRLLYDRKEAARQLSISVRSLDYIIAAIRADQMLRASWAMHGPAN